MRETDLLRSLRAVRQFSDQPIPRDILLDILDVGRWTGSSKNTQPWDLIVVEERTTLQALAKCGEFAGHLAGARLGIALVMHGDDAWTCMDEGRLMQNLMLAAWAHGVGSCIGSIYPSDNEQRAKDLLSIPRDRFLRTVLSVGYPASPQALRLPRGASVPRGRRPLDDLVSWERFGVHAR
ncbi:MAG TPA: nitroreductase family protein [Candidatus Limnocylindrales bacterium]|nr:nitroreductase family protein [Candidatus Limnocylindrales bacterium]